MNNILLQTPHWVFGIFIYLFIIGIRSTKDRVVKIHLLFIVPVVFMVQKYRALSPYDASVFFTYIFTLLVFLRVGFSRAKRIHIKWIDQTHIKLPGSYEFLILILIFFCAKYYFGYQQATNLKNYSECLIFYDVMITAAFSGYLLGKNINYMVRKKL